MDTLSTTDLNLARAFFGSYRYIDDTLSVDIDSFVRLTGDHEPSNPPIYPDFLLLTKTIESTSSTDFLGMTVTSCTDSFVINIASTTKRFPVKKANYPSLKGNFPKVLAYAVLTGQLHRFARICTLTHDFVSNAIGMGRLLLTKGYSKRKLAQYFYQFVSSRYPQANMPKAEMCHRFKNGITKSSPRDA